MDKVPNARIRELYGVTKGVDERTQEGVILWFGHVERMENGRILLVLLSRQRKKQIDIMKGYLKKRGLDVRHPRKMGHDSSVWWGFVRGECIGCRPWDEPLNLTI